MKNKINPWIGLNPYSEGEKLYGRDDDAARFIQMLLSERVVVLCGRSGVGKTSFISACVCSAVREKGIIPIMIRLFHFDNENSYISQIIQSIKKNVAELQGKAYLKELYPLKEGQAETFLGFFRRYKIIDNNGQTLTPLLIMDQFEEMFLNNDLSFIKQIDEAVPDVFKDENGEEITPFYLLISIREYFVSFIDRCFTSKEFRFNRYYLDELNGEQAYKVITKNGETNIDKKTAVLIIQSITGNKKPSSEDIPRCSVSPLMLSVYMNRLFEKSFVTNQGVITEELVNSYDAIYCFTDLYNEASNRLSIQAKEYLEDVLVTVDGRRNNISELDVLRSGFVNKEELEVLERHHIIRHFLYGKDIRIELTSDIFCPIIYDHSYEREKTNYHTLNRKRFRSSLFSHIVRKMFLPDKNEDKSSSNDSVPQIVEYDIFISYRRKDATGNIAGRDIARGFKHYLEAKGYSCFFDYSECDDGEFENIIIPAVGHSKYFLLVMTNGALDRCLEERDWVRREFCEAINKNLKIVPIAITDNEHPEISFHGLPSSLPAPLNKLEKIQWSEVSMGSLYEVSVDLMIKRRLKKNK